MTLKIEINKDIVNAQLNGRLDTAAALQFATDMQPLNENADKHIVLDCAGLDFIASSGLRLLLSLRKQTIAKGGDVTIKNVNSDVKQVFTITGFLNLFKFE